jgi:hypothetical protein
MRRRRDWKRGSGGSYDTKNDTKLLSEVSSEVKSLKEWRALGDDFRTLTLTQMMADIPFLDQIPLAL